MVPIRSLNNTEKTKMQHDIRFQAINEDNFEDIMDLELHPEQEGNLASNAYSVAQMAYYDNFIGYGIYLGEEPIGFIMHAVLPELADPQELAIYRFMVDKRHQGQGIGTQALRQLIKRLPSDFPRAERITICYHSDKPDLRAFYQKLGFVEVGFDPDSFGEDGSGPGDNVAEIRLR